MCERTLWQHSRMQLSVSNRCRRKLAEEFASARCLDCQLAQSKKHAGNVMPSAGAFTRRLSTLVLRQATQKCSTWLGTSAAERQHKGKHQAMHRLGISRGVHDQKGQRITDKYQQCLCSTSCCYTEPLQCTEGLAGLRNLLASTG